MMSFAPEEFFGGQIHTGKVDFPSITRLKLRSVERTELHIDSHEFQVIYEMEHQ